MYNTFFYSLKEYKNMKQNKNNLFPSPELISSVRILKQDFPLPLLMLKYGKRNFRHL